MQQLFNLLKKAESSKIYLRLLNYITNRTVRFNKPHGFKIIKITPEFAQTFAPYHKKNFNHVRGIHACAIATVGELAAGLILMNHFSPKEYRLIMSQIHIDYHYQAKRDIIATASLLPHDKEHIMNELKEKKKTTQPIITEIKDANQQSIATVVSTWQIKSWDDVRTQVK